MEYKGKVYGKINGKYIECTETVEDLEKRIKQLEFKEVYLVQSKENLIVFGCFLTKEKAEKFTNNSPTLAINKIEVI